MKKLLCIVIILSMLCTIMPASAVTEKFKRCNSLTTTGDPTRYSIFETDGDTIKASGFYKNDVVVNFNISGTGLNNNNLIFNPQTDGSYIAEFKQTPAQNPSSAIISVSLQSGTSLNYTVEYADGWYFPDLTTSDNMTLSERNLDIIENYATVETEVTVQYLVGENGTHNDIAAVLDELTRLSAEITQGISDDYDKARAISGWVADNLHYDRDARDNEVTLETVALKNVITYRKGICSGYANLTAALMDAAGLKSVTVIGTALSLGELDVLLTRVNHHEWAAFWYEKENRWVMMDSGWDSYNHFEDGKYVTSTAPRRYFDISPLAFAQNHRVDKAEFRDYFAAFDYVFPDSTDEYGVANSSGDIISKPKSSDNAIIKNYDDDNYEDFDHSEYYKELFLLIGISVAITAAMAVVTIVTIKKRKK